MDLLNIESDESPRFNARMGEMSGDVRPAASVGERIWNIVQTKFPFAKFTSSDVLEMYEDHYNEPIKLSIISTYLSRYSERGRLARVRQGKEWTYRAGSPAQQQMQPHFSPATVPGQGQ